MTDLADLFAAWQEAAQSPGGFTLHFESPEAAQAHLRRLYAFRARTLRKFARTLPPGAEFTTHPWADLTTTRNGSTLWIGRISSKAFGIVAGGPEGGA